MCVEHQAGESVRREPDRAVLILKLRAEWMRRMSAQVGNGGQRSARAVRNVKISGDVQTRQALKDNFLNAIRVAFEATGDLRLKRSAFGQRIKAEHVE
jgi:hypothetical protein